MPVDDKTRDFYIRAEQQGQWARDAKAAIEEYERLEKALPGLRKQKEDAENAVATAARDAEKAKAQSQRNIEIHARAEAEAKKALDDIEVAAKKAQAAHDAAVAAQVAHLKDRSDEAASLHSIVMAKYKNEEGEAQKRLDTINLLIAQAKGL